MLKNPKQTKKQSPNNNGVVFFCTNCNEIGKVYVECWTDTSEGPYKILLVQHSDEGAIIVDDIRISVKPRGEKIKYHHCGTCGEVLAPPYDKDFLVALDRFNPATPKN